MVPPQLAESHAHGRAEARAAGRAASRARRSITGMVNTSHHTATVTNDTRTACARIREAEQRGLATMSTLTQEQQPAAEIAQRIAEGGDAVESLGLRDVEQQRIVEHDAAVEADRAEHEQQRRRTTALGRPSTAPRSSPTPSKVNSDRNLLAAPPRSAIAPSMGASNAMTRLAMRVAHSRAARWSRSRRRPCSRTSGRTPGRNPPSPWWRTRSSPSRTAPRRTLAGSRITHGASASSKGGQRLRQARAPGGLCRSGASTPADCDSRVSRNCRSRPALDRELRFTRDGARYTSAPA